jgi:hypothetical protein
VKERIVLGLDGKDGSIGSSVRSVLSVLSEDKFSLSGEDTFQEFADGLLVFMMKTAGA